MAELTPDCSILFTPYSFDAIAVSDPSRSSVLYRVSTADACSSREINRIETRNEGGRLEWLRMECSGRWEVSEGLSLRGWLVPLTQNSSVEAISRFITLERTFFVLNRLLACGLSSVAGETVSLN